VAIREDSAYVGGGSLPDQQLPTIVIAVAARDLSDAELARRLRMSTPAVMTRVQDGHVLLDLRTIIPEQEPLLVQAFRTVIQD
jgi:L-seryl-tRNA(Ser) seleniumtransferase